ncbi:MAG: Lyzozyme M1 (1,4-beta-N-acetylmuramidase) [Lachnospiraceae bacterium]|nr:Lyzozyme M1 (1,4-beta-N-acetylmuramidase) [Lachnospiraceae bacterium]
MLCKKCLAVFMLAAILTGCSGTPEERQESAVDTGGPGIDTGEAEIISEAENHGEETPVIYSFVDVYGESYEAVLKEEVPANVYEYSRIREIGGYKYYTDETGNPVSRLGIDVSRYQSEADWRAVKEAGIDFVMIRCGFRGYGESGVLKEDERFQTHLAGAREAGLDVGVYFFSQAVTEEEAVEEAEFVLTLLEGQEVSGPVVYDTEEIRDDTARTDFLTPAQITDHAVAFCERIRRAGYKPMIYANMKWLVFSMEYERLSDYEIWYADYEPVPQSPYRIRMWQYTEEGRVPGIEGNVDLNVWFP